MTKEEEFFIYLINKMFYNGVIDSKQQNEMIDNLNRLYNGEEGIHG